MKGRQKKQKPLYLVCQDLSAQISSQVRLVKDTDKLEEIEVTMRTLLKQLKEATETEDGIDIIPFYDKVKKLGSLDPIPHCEPIPQYRRKKPKGSVGQGFDDQVAAAKINILTANSAPVIEIEEEIVPFSNEAVFFKSSKAIS